MILLPGHFRRIISVAEAHLRRTNSLDRARRLPVLSEDVETTLAGLPFHWLRYGGVAHEALYCSHIPLVYGLARRFAHSDDMREELVQEGAIALWFALGRHDPKRGRVAAFAKPFVWRAMVRARGLSVVRLPDRVRWQLALVLRAHDALVSSLGRQPTTAEVVQRVTLVARRHHDDDPSGAEACAVCARNSAWVTEQRVSLLLRIVNGKNLVVFPGQTEEGTGGLVRTLADSGPGPEDSVVDALVIRQEVARSLDAREAAVIRGRFGIDSAELTLGELGRQLGCSGERVRQIEVQALAKLRRALTPSRD